jgi:hypothetical protein
MQLERKIRIQDFFSLPGQPKVVEYTNIVEP